MFLNGNHFSVRLMMCWTSLALSQPLVRQSAAAVEQLICSKASSKALHSMGIEGSLINSSIHSHLFGNDNDGLYRAGCMWDMHSSACFMHFGRSPLQSSGKFSSFSTHLHSGFWGSLKHSCMSLLHLTGVHFSGKSIVHDNWLTLKKGNLQQWPAVKTILSVIKVPSQLPGKISWGSRTSVPFSSGI